MTSRQQPDRILRVDLEDTSVTSEAIPPRWLREFIGGKGLGARYLYETVEPGCDPLGPDNVLCIMRGPFSGYLPGSTRFAAITKSPLTGLFVDSYAGGVFATELVGALGSHLGVLIEGAAETPLELHLEDGSATLTSAQDRWGMTAGELEASVDDAAVAGPGLAGERMVTYATIATDGGDHHAGRGGTGAVMGAKRLKAIIARGDIPTDPTLEAVKARYEQRFEDHPRGQWHRSSGTVETVDAADALGILPTEGWRSGRFDRSDEIGIQAIRAATHGRERAMEAIPGDFEFDEVVARGALGISLGANLGIGDLDAVLELGQRCDSLGLDVIETGNAIAWAMLASERGLIDHELAIGDVEAARTLIDAIATRSTPLGDRLAEGIDHASAHYGGDDLVPTIKSMSAASYDPRPAPAMALAFATSDRGACHRRSLPAFEEVLDTERWDDERRVEAVITQQDLRSLLWCFIVDDVTVPAFEDDLGEGYVAAVGWDLERENLARIGERVWTLTRLFNVREGVTGEDDRLPAAFSRPLHGGPHAGSKIEEEPFERLLQLYYRARGWGSGGRPTEQLVEQVGLDDVVDDLELAHAPAGLDHD